MFYKNAPTVKRSVMLDIIITNLRAIQKPSVNTQVRTTLFEPFDPVIFSKYAFLLVILTRMKLITPLNRSTGDLTLHLLTLGKKVR